MKRQTSTTSTRLETAEAHVERLQRELIRLEAASITAEGRIKAMDRQIGELEASAEAWRDIAARSLGAHASFADCVLRASNQDKKDGRP
jgi:septal ring factor EnvC (AmiA/AmiB activator)